MEIRIGSFNMNNFGGSSNKDFGKIAEIIVEENLDVERCKRSSAREEA